MGDEGENSPADCFRRGITENARVEADLRSAHKSSIFSGRATQIPPPQPKTKAVHWTAFSFLERCVPHAERDAHFVRDDGFAL